jgi:hypothetical protein
MTAMYPDTKPWDFTFLQYLENPTPPPTSKTGYIPRDPDSVLSFIAGNADLQDFYQIVKIADMERDLDGNLKGFTIFLPICCRGIDLLLLDRLEARKIVMLSMLPAKLYQRDLITGLFDTYLKNYQLWIDRGVVNKKTPIIMYNFSKSNGLVHIVEKLPML